nr:hypothetical protein [Actinomadura madurae]
MTVPAGVRQPFQDEHPGALGPGGAVGRRGERLRPPVRGETALPG